MITNKAINPAQLSYELGNAPLKVVGPYEDGTYKVESETKTDAELTAAINAHVKDDNFIAPAVQAEINAAQVASTNENTINGLLDQSIAAMKAHVTRGTFTSAQRDAALILVLRVCIGLARLVRRKLDQAE